jgi:Tol biopolymer transport system component
MRFLIGRSSLVALLALVLVLLGALPAAAKVGGQNGRIVFSRFTADFSDSFTYIVDSGGGGPRPLFRLFPSDSPRWSPNGTEIAISSGVGRPCCDFETSTVIINPDTGVYRVVTPEGPPAVFNGTCTLWSPDATRFACEGQSDADPSVDGVYTVRTSDGGGLKRVTNGPDVPIDYSPNGNQIVFSRAAHPDCTPNSALYVVNIDGSGLHRITPYGFCDDRGGWSPNGQWIVFVRNPIQRNERFHFSRGGQLFVVHPDGSGLTQIVPQPGSRLFTFDASWSPDGTKIIFSFANQMTTGIATANADGSDFHQLTDNPISADHQADWGRIP